MIPALKEPQSSAGEAGPASFLGRASLTDWSMLVDYCQRRRYQPGDAVLEQGQAGRSLLIVLSGALRLAKTRTWRARSGDETIEAGSIVGELGFVDGAARSTTVEAAETAEVLILEWEAFERLAAARPTLGIMLLEDLARIIAARFREVAGSDE